VRGATLPRYPAMTKLMRLGWKVPSCRLFARWVVNYRGPLSFFDWVSGHCETSGAEGNTEMSTFKPHRCARFSCLEIASGNVADPEILLQAKVTITIPMKKGPISARFAASMPPSLSNGEERLHRVQTL